MGLGFRKAVLLAAVSCLMSLAAISQDRPAITGISHVAFYSDDFAKSQEFYQTLLGWHRVSIKGPATALRFYSNHAQYVELLAPPTPGQINRLDHVAFVTTDAEKLRSYIGSKGVAVPATITKDNDGSRSFRVHDPEGNSVEFIQPGKVRIAAPPAAELSKRLSTTIMHAGYMVRDRAALDRFYKDVLGFHLYWQGGAKPTDVDWVMMQVPEGSAWIEYMLNLPKQPNLAQLGSANHVAPGVIHVADLQKMLEQRGWKAPGKSDPKILGVDGKMQLDLRDPDGTRIEFMEFTPVAKPCCSAYTGKQPVPYKGW